MVIQRVKRHTTLPPSVQHVLGGVESMPEHALLARVKWIGLPAPETQVQLIEGRKYRYDCVWPEFKVCAEVQGGQYVGGRHNRAAGYESDATKSALAQIAGYICLYVTPQMIDSGVAGHLIREALKSRGWTPGIRVNEPPRGMPMTSARGVRAEMTTDNTLGES